MTERFLLYISETFPEAELIGTVVHRRSTFSIQLLNESRMEVGTPSFDDFGLNEDEVIFSIEDGRVSMLFTPQRLVGFLDSHNIREISRYYDILDQITALNLGVKLDPSEYSMELEEDPLVSTFEGEKRDEMLESLQKVEKYISKKIDEVELKKYQIRNVQWAYLLLRRELKTRMVIDKYVKFGEYFYLKVGAALRHFRKGACPTIINDVSVTGGIISDEVGMGKTITALSILQMDKHFEREIVYTRISNGAKDDLKDFYLDYKSPDILNTNTALIIVPNQMIQHWKSEIEEKYPKLKVLVLEDKSKKDHFALTTLKNYKKYDVVLVSFNFIKNTTRFRPLIEKESYMIDPDAIGEEQGAHARGRRRKREMGFWMQYAGIIREQLGQNPNALTERMIIPTALNWRMVIIDEAHSFDEISFLNNVFTGSLFLITGTPNNETYQLFGYDTKLRYDPNVITRRNTRESIKEDQPIGVPINEVTLEFHLKEKYFRDIRVINEMVLKVTRISDILASQGAGAYKLKIPIREYFNEEMMVFGAEDIKSFERGAKRYTSFFSGRVEAVAGEIKEFVKFFQSEYTNSRGEFVPLRYSARRMEQETLRTFNELGAYIVENYAQFKKSVKDYLKKAPNFPHKIEQTHQFIANFLEEDEERKLIIQYKNEAELVAFQIMAKGEYKYANCKGTRQSKEKAVREFLEEDKIRVIFLDEGSATGLNLVNACDVLITYNAPKDLEEQVIGRSNRMNQTKAITVYKVLASYSHIDPDTEEEAKVFEKAVKGKGQAGPQRAGRRRVQIEDMADYYSSSGDE